MENNLNLYYRFNVFNLVLSNLVCMFDSVVQNAVVECFQELDEDK